MRRAMKWSGLGLGVVAIGVAAVVALDRSGVVDVLPDGILGDDASDKPEDAQGAGPEVLYLRGSTLHVYDVSAQRDEELTDVPSAQVAASPRTSWIAYIAPEATEGVENEVPTVHVFEPTTEADTAIGLGFSPLWDHTGTRLAYLRPEDSSGCISDQCPGDREVVLLDPDTREEEVLLEAGPWTLHMWAGDRLLVSEGINPSRTDAVSTDGERSTLDVPPSSIRDASPDGRWLVTVGDETEFVPLENGEVVGDPISIPLKGSTLSEGAWSHDSSEIAAVLLSGLSEPVVFSPDNPTPRPVEDGFFAAGPVLWTQEDDALVVPRVINAQRGRLQAFFCPLEGEDAQCEGLFSFRRKVVLLRMQ